ncbi:MAG: GNAT family N-acetyltransferase [Chloroflexi bacterium]|nr:GNAT family N-acetyltransferase [Chloroflexota bacterium]MCZ7577421.1 GNAT family N-acetyltransferase [Dehalococcoidia bacterium]NJD66935.1 GNAT family N-acetyltransferase [Chloroflexota bacterium]PWB43763.1 MAG: N-acetyltransferase [Dehalococcoidia bacterium]
MPLRPATEADLDTIIELIHALAEYEREPEAVRLVPGELRRHLFGPRPYAEVILAETGEGASAGFALFFHNFSTWEGKPGIYLEDLFVRPEFRGQGYGKALLAELARLAVERGCARLEWAVLDWNEPSIQFYRALGAAPMDEWTTYRLSGEALATLARG